MTRTVLPHMVAAGSGRIVNINSGAAYRNYDIATAYNVGKGALARLTAATGLNADRTACVRSTWHRAWSAPT